MRVSLIKNRSLYRDLLRIHPAEVLPLVISVAIVVQGLVFIVIQSRAKNVITHNCQAIAQVIWPGTNRIPDLRQELTFSVLWLVPYTMLVFGLETTFRSLHGKRFQGQKWWHLTTALTAIFVITLATWVPSNVFSRHGECLASLVWWTSHFAKLGLVIGTGLMFTFIVCACVITGQLLRIVDMHKNERIAATRIVYYLIVSTIILVSSKGSQLMQNANGFCRQW